MERELIIKALECCYEDDKSCLTCPFQAPDKYLECAGLALSARSLIKELTEENERLRADTIEEYRQKVNTKMGKHTHLLGKEYVQRILREVKKEMVGDKDV